MQNIPLPLPDSSSRIRSPLGNSGLRYCIWKVIFTSLWSPKQASLVPGTQSSNWNHSQQLCIYIYTSWLWQSSWIITGMNLFRIVTSSGKQWGSNCITWSLCMAKMTKFSFSKNNYTAQCEFVWRKIPGWLISREIMKMYLCCNIRIKTEQSCKYSASHQVSPQLFKLLANPVCRINSALLFP